MGIEKVPITELLDFIVDYFSSKNIYPTFDEMRKFLNIKSKSGVHKLLSSLEDKGIIERLPHKARALKLKKVIDFPKVDEKNLPFLGRIAAGNPIEAITGSFEQISVPNYLLNSKDEHFTLEVAGDSMNDEGIRDGDIVVIKKVDQAKYIGVTLDSNLSFKFHIENICNKISSYFRIFYYLKSIMGKICSSTIKGCCKKSISSWVMV